MRTRTRISAGFLLLLALLPCGGCITWPSGTDKEEPSYPEFLREGLGGTVGVAVFSDETGLTRNRWARRNVFTAVSGTLLGIVPWPWDLRLVWSPPAIEEDWKAPLVRFDENFSAAIAARMENYGFKGAMVDPRKVEGGLETDLKALLKVAGDAGCKVLYVVSYNEFTKLRFRTELRRHQGYLYHRIKNLEGSALIPSVALLRVPGGERMLTRSNVARKGNRYVEYFWQPLFTFGRWSPFDQASSALERFVKDVSGKEINEARERCADFLVHRDFTLDLPAGGAETPTEPPPEKPPGEKPPGEKPPVEKPPVEKPPGEKPPGETPPGEKPPGEQPPGEKPPGETPPGEKPPGDQPPGEKPPGEVPPGEKPPGEQPPGEQPPGEEPPGDKPPGESQPGQPEEGKTG